MSFENVAIKNGIRGPPVAYPCVVLKRGQKSIVYSPATTRRLDAVWGELYDRGKNRTLCSGSGVFAGATDVMSVTPRLRPCSSVHVC